MSEKEPLKVVVQKAPAQIRNAEDLEFQELLDTVMGTIKPGIVKLQEQLTSMQGALSTLSPLDTNTVIAVVEQYIGTPIDTTEKAQIIAFIESGLEDTHKQKDILTLMAIKGINGLLADKFRANPADIDPMKRDSSYAIYFSAGNPVATTNPSVYKVVDDAKYTSQNTPAYAWAGFLNALVSNIGAELPQIDIVVESLVVEDMIRDELAQLKYKVETKSMPAELQQALIDFEKTYLKVNPKVIEVTEIDIFRKQAELLKQEFEDELAITKTTSPWDTKKIQYLEQKLARLTTVTETLSTEQSQRVMREITSINNTLNKAGVNLNELTGLKSEIVKVQASITSLRSYTITPDVTRELDKQEALLKDLATLLGKKTELLQNTNEITRLQQLIAKRERKDPVTKESYAKKVKTLEKANITLEADVATLQGKAYTPVAPIPKQKGDELSKSGTQKPNSSPEKVSDPEKELNLNPKYVDISDTLTAEGQTYFDTLLQKEYTSEKEINEAFSPLLSNKTRANLVAKYILEVGAIKDRDVFEKELTGMPKHYRVYLRKYNKIVEKENRSIADKVKKQMKVENTYLDKHIGTIRERRKTGKVAKTMAKHETKKMKMIEKAVGYQLQKERLEQQNKRTASYGSYLSSYDLGQAPVKFPGAYPSPKLLLEEIQKANGPLWESMQFLGYTDPQKVSNLLSSPEMVDRFYGGENGLLGYPILLPAATADAFAKSTPRSVFDEHNREIPIRSEASNAYLTEEFRLTIMEKKKNNDEYYSRGYVSLFKELAIRHLAGREGFSFVSYTKALRDNPQLVSQNPEMAAFLGGLSDTDIMNYLQDGMYATIDPSVVASIQESYVQYRNLRPGQTREQLVSLYFVKALHEEYDIPVSQKEYVKDRLLEVRGGNRHQESESTMGNQQVGERVIHFIENGTPDQDPLSGMGLGKDRLDGSLSLKQHLVKSDGSSRGMGGMVDIGVRELTSSLGVDPKHAPKIAAFTKIGLAAVAASYGRQFVFGELLKPGTTFGEKLRKIGVTAGLIAIGPRLLLNRTPGETWDYLIKGGKDGEGVIKGDGSKLLQYFGYEGDPEKQDPRVYENTKSTVRVLGELKLGNLRKYITKKEGTMVNRAAFFMSDAQKKAFMADTTISTHAKETLQRLITSKSGNMDEVSRVLDSGLVRSGVTHTKREELISQSPQKDMTLSEFQMQRDEMKKFEEGSVGGLIQDKDKLEDIYYMYTGRTAEQQRLFAKRVEEMQALESKRRELVPYLQYHFLTYRKDLFPTVGIDASDQSLLLAGLANKTGRSDQIYRYLQGDMTQDTDTDTMRQEKFQAAFTMGLFTPDAEVSAFMKKYFFADDALQQLKQIDGGNRSSSDYPTMRQSRINATTDGWILGDSEYNVGGVQELRLHDIPEGAAKEEVFLRVNPETSRMSFWLKNTETKQREEYELQHIGGIDAKTYAIARDPDFLTELTMVVQGYDDPLIFDYKLLGTMVKRLHDHDLKFRVERDRIKQEDQEMRWDRIADKLGNAWDHIDQVTDKVPGLRDVVDAGEDIANAVGDAAEDLGAAAGELIPNPRIEFRKTGKVRPAR